MNDLHKKIDLLHTRLTSLELEKTEAQEQINSKFTQIQKFQDSRIWLAEKRLRSEFFNLHFYLERSGMINSPDTCESPIYNLYFYDNNRYYSFISAKEVFKIILPVLLPSSIIDFGCGTGTWLYASKAYGIKRVLGIDGDYIPKNLLMIREDEFQSKNLQEKVDVGKQFDLVISVEVAEHLPENKAEIFIDTLCRHGNIILFSAAHPGQGGDHHLNEQPFEYWKKKFEQRDYHHIEIRNLFHNNSEIEWWYRNNIALYVKGNYNITF